MYDYLYEISRKLNEDQIKVKKSIILYLGLELGQRLISNVDEGTFWMIESVQNWITINADCYRYINLPQTTKL